MGAGASVDLPDRVDREAVISFAGDRYNEEVFATLVEGDGCIPKEKLMDLLDDTDCFLTHDWGMDEMGRSNHERVSRINDELKQRGLVTWFDTDRLTGNIVQQMCDGIDNSQCIIVFITKNYVEKVSGSNPNDNCQLEFSYAFRRKTAKFMVPVVMEARMRSTSLWAGAVGMALGGALYIDFVSDEANKWESQCDQLFKMVVNLIQPLSQKLANPSYDLSLAKSSMSQSMKMSGGGKPPPEIELVRQSTLGDVTTGTASTINTVSLDSLTVTQVTNLLGHLNLGQYASKLKELRVDGATLAMVQSAEELKEMGVDMAAKARLLFSKIEKFVAGGVSEDKLAEAPSSIKSNSGFEQTQAAEKSKKHEARGPPSVNTNPHLSVSSSTRPTTAYAGAATMTLSPAASTASVNPVFLKSDGDIVAPREVAPTPNPHITGSLVSSAAGIPVGAAYVPKSKQAQPSSVSINKSPRVMGKGPSMRMRAVFPYSACSPVMSYKFSGAENTTNIYKQSYVTIAGSMQVRGAFGTMASKVNGIYYPTTEASGGYYIYQKKGDPDMWLEFNEKNRSWQIKSTVAKGTASCAAELRLSADDLQQFTTSSSFSPRGYKELDLGICFDMIQEWQLFDGVSAFFEQSTMKVLPVARNVHVRGTTGVAATKVVGIYIATADVTGGLPLYQKYGDIDMWLEYNTNRKKWQIKSTEGRGSNSCIAEVLSDPVFPEVGTADNDWMVFDSKEFVKQSGMKLLPESPEIRLIGCPPSVDASEVSPVVAKARAFMGSYIPSNELSCRKPVYLKSNDRNVCIEYNDQRRSWQIKTVKAMGTPNCIAEMPSAEDCPIVSIGSNNSSNSNWVLADGMQPIPNMCCLASTVTYSYSTSTSFTWSRDDDLTDIHILGVTGAASALFQGVYTATHESCGDAFVYNKKKNQDIWLEYCARKGRWQVKSTAVKGTAKCVAEVAAPCTCPSDYMDINGPLKVSGNLGEWDVSNGGSFEKMPSMKALPLTTSLHILGAQGTKADKLNGIYSPTDELKDGMIIYQKQTDPDMWIEFNNKNRAWQVKHTKDKGQSKAWAYMNCDLIYPPEQCRGTFNVYDDTLKWQAQPTMMLLPLHKSLRVSGAEGSHASDLNAYYDPVNQVSGGVVCYEQRDNSNIIIEYNESMKSWQVKHKRDKGEKKAWAYFTTLLRLSPEESVILTVPGKGMGCWQVFDDSKKWHEQPQFSLRGV